MGDEPAPAPHHSNGGPDTRAEDRGTLVVRDKVVERIATRAALDTAGVEHHAEGLGKLIGRDLPRIDVRVAGDRVRAHLDIAARWPASLPDLTGNVRTNVARALTEYAGLTVDAVDVTVAAVVLAPTDTPRRNLR